MTWVLLAAYYATAMAMGVSEAAMYHKQNPNVRLKVNEHKLFTIERMAAFAPLVYWWYTHGVWYGAIAAVSIMMAFSYPHNTAYYWYRHRLNDQVYEHWMTARSTTSSARFELGFTLRVVLFVIGTFALCYTAHLIHGKS